MIFVLILMNIYYPKHIYKHQIFSIIFIAIINTVLLIFSSLFKIYNNGSQNIYEYKGYYLCAFAIIIYIDVSFLIFYARIHGKIAMDIDFISPYEIIIIIGILGFLFDLFIYLIGLLINTHQKCAKIQYQNESNIYCYLDIFDFSEIKKINFNWADILKEIILQILYLIICFINLVCELLIIKYLNLAYILTKRSGNKFYYNKFII